MSDVNPYQSPQHSEPAIRLSSAELVTPEIWCDGNLLVMDKRAVLPDRCVKSNQPAHGRRLRRKLYWHHPLVYLALLGYLILYVILAAIMSESAEIEIGLSEEWFERRRRAIIIGWCSALASVGLFVLGVSLVEDSAGPMLMIAAPVLFIAGAIYGLIAARMVAPKRITNEHVWLKGVDPLFLAELPQWPGG